MREYTDIGARIGVGLTTWWFPPMIRKGGRHVSPCVTSRMRLAYEMRDTSPRDLAYEMRPPHAYHWAQWCVLITREYDIGVGLTFLRDDFPLWYARAVDTSPRDLAYEMRDTWPCVTSRMRCDRRTRITGRCKAYPHNDVTRETHHTSDVTFQYNNSRLHGLTCALGTISCILL